MKTINIVYVVQMNNRMPCRHNLSIYLFPLFGRLLKGIVSLNGPPQKMSVDDILISNQLTHWQLSFSSIPKTAEHIFYIQKKISKKLFLVYFSSNNFVNFFFRNIIEIMMSNVWFEKIFFLCIKTILMLFHHAKFFYWHTKMSCFDLKLSDFLLCVALQRWYFFWCSIETIK